MVSIGSFAHPSAIALQARVIRATCGADTPILVSDDHTETAFDTEKSTDAEHGRRLKSRLLQICEAENLIYRDTAPDRIGHAGGDLGAFCHGLTYAERHGIDYVVKLSQRLMVDVPNWIDDTIDLMEPGRFGPSIPDGFATACAPCFYEANPYFAMRTECVVMRVRDWFQPWVMEQLVPRPLGFAAELLIDTIVRRLSTGHGFINVPGMTKDRYERRPGWAWKDALPKESTDRDYAELATKYGMTLGAEFNSHHSVHIHGYAWG